MIISKNIHRCDRRLGLFQTKRLKPDNSKRPRRTKTNLDPELRQNFSSDKLASVEGQGSLADPSRWDGS